MKNEQVAWLVVRVIISIIAVAFVLYGFVWVQPCNGIDDEFLSCRLTGTGADVIGILLFGVGMLAITGFFNFFKGFRQMYSPIGSTSGNLILAAIMVAGWILFWFF